jgi:hypothetical protein
MRTHRNWRTIRLHRIGDRWLVRGERSRENSAPERRAGGTRGRPQQRGLISLDVLRSRLLIHLEDEEFSASFRLFGSQQDAHLWRLEGGGRTLRAVVRPGSGGYVWRTSSKGNDGFELTVRTHGGPAVLRDAGRRLAVYRPLSILSALVRISEGDGPDGGEVSPGAGTDGRTTGLVIGCFAPQLWRPA